MSQFKAGDAVMVVKPRTCCGDIRNLGKVFTVQQVKIVKGYRCVLCGFRVENVLLVVRSEKRRSGFLPEVLKKLEPPAEGELRGVPLRLKEPA